MNSEQYAEMKALFNTRLNDLDLPAQTDLVVNGEIQRVGPNNNGWYALDDDGGAIYGNYGNWKNHEPDQDWGYFEYIYNLDGDHKGTRNQQTTVRDINSEISKKLARQIAEQVWESCYPVKEHNYLAAKQVRAYNIKIDTRGNLVIPFRDTAGILHTLQTIDGAGKKRWLKNGAKKGHYFKIEGDPSQIYIAEGYATCATIHQATGMWTVMAGDKGNLVAVVRIIRSKLPNSKLIIAADVDAYADLMSVATEVDAAIVRPQGVEGNSYDFNDLASVKGLDEVRSQLQNEEHSNIQTPEPLRRADLPIHEFPIDALGLILKPAALKIHEMIQAPLAMCCQSVLAGASLGVQGLVDVEIDGRKRPTTEFFITIGGSGERKSAVDEAALAPHRIKDRQLYDQYILEKELHSIDLESWNLQKKELKSKTLAQGEYIDNTREIGQKPEAPLLPNMFVNEPTIEGLTRLLQDGRPSVGVFSDEGGMVIGGYSFSKEKALHTGAAYSKFWDGNPIDRIRGSEISSKLYGRRVAMHLMMQPKSAAAFLQNEMLLDQGFLTRCLPSYPESTVGSRPYKEIHLQDPVLAEYNLKLLDILNLELALEEGSHQILAPRTIGLDKGAKQIWMEFHNYCDQQSASGGEYEEIRGFANKAPEHALRLSGILAAISNPTIEYIGIREISDGIRLTNYYLHEWLRIVGNTIISPDLLLAENLLGWLKSKGDKFVYPLKIYQYGPNSIRSKRDALRILAILEEHGHLIKLKERMKLDGSFRKDIWRLI